MKQKKIQIKQLRKQKKAFQLYSENFKKIDVQEKELQVKYNTLNDEFAEKKELYKENFGLKMKLIRLFYKVAFKLKILK